MAENITQPEPIRLADGSVATPQSTSDLVHNVVKGSDAPVMPELNSTKVVAPQTTEEAAVEATQAVENNNQETPHLSISDDGSKLQVIGDANAVNTTKGDYELTFTYPEEEVAEADRPRMKYDEKEKTYSLKMRFERRRIKPLYASRAAMYAAQITRDMLNLYNQLGTEPAQTSRTQSADIFMRVFMNDFEYFVELAHIVLGVSKEQLEYVDSVQMINFFTQLMVNEPNLINEGMAFLQS